MKIEIISFGLYKKGKTVQPLQHWSNEDYIEMQKMDAVQCIKYLEDYIRENNMRILNVSTHGASITCTLLRE